LQLRNIIDKSAIYFPPLLKMKHEPQLTPMVYLYLPATTNQSYIKIAKVTYSKIVSYYKMTLQNRRNFNSWTTWSLCADTRISLTAVNEW